MYKQLNNDVEIEERKGKGGPQGAEGTGKSGARKKIKRTGLFMNPQQGAFHDSPVFRVFYARSVCKVQGLDFCAFRQ